MQAHVGDRLLVEGDEARMGLIIGVPQSDGSPPYIVKWLSNGHISMVSPGVFARLIPVSHPPDDAAPESEPFGSDHRDQGPASAQVGAAMVELNRRTRPSPGPSA